jgi:ABC-type lipoprotein release transport system permease subunit
VTAALVIAMLAGFAAARRSAAIVPGEVLRDDT